MAVGDGVSAIASLTVGFGGFSPTAFDGTEETRKGMDQAERAIARMREMKEQRLALDRARTSRPHTWSDESATWTYVIVDEKVIRIVACATESRTLFIPAEIDGLPVSEIASDACARIDSIEEVVCPDTVELIGACAFRLCPNLKSIVLPANVKGFSASWLQHDHSLEMLVLPGMLDKITSAVFDNAGIKRLRIGKNVKIVEPGAFEKTQLEIIELDSENPHLISDGSALYSADGTVLFALCKPERHYDVKEGCVKIAKKAFCNIHSLKSVSLPKSLQVVGKFAFAHSSIERISLPEGVRVIGEKAFYHCKSLEEVELNDGLKRIDDAAFEDSALKSLSIPASIDKIGTSIVANTNVIASGEHATISIDAASQALFLDGSGGLYRREDDGVHLVQLIDENAESFVAYPDTAFIDERAFAFHDSIQSASFSEGLIEVGDSAFRVCRNLIAVTLPDTVRSIGRQAFIDTRLASFRVPASLAYLGEEALVSAGAHHLSDHPQISHIDVAPGNERFYMDGSMLIERTDEGGHLVVFTGEESDVVISPDVRTIAAYAFSNARGIRTLSIPSSVKIVSTAGLAVWSYIENIHVDVAQPIEGRTSFDFRFPMTARSTHSISLALGGSSWINVPDIMAQYDNCIANAHDYQGNNRDSISIYDQVSRVIDRLRDPILLTNVNRRNFDRLMRTHLEEICVDIARHDDRQAIDALLEFGYLNEGNLEDVITAVGRLQDAAMTSYLLEVKRRRFNRRVFDFEL